MATSRMGTPCMSCMPSSRGTPRSTVLAGSARPSTKYFIMLASMGWPVAKIM
jgi:hypothetical protein